MAKVFYCMRRKHISCLVVAIVGIPYVFYSGIEGDLNILVMELLGDNLENLMYLVEEHCPLRLCG